MTPRPIRDKAKEAEGLSSTDAIAFALAVGWMGAVGLFFLILPPVSDPDAPFDSLRLVLMLIAIFLPVAMIWVAAAAARSARIMREESFRVQTAIDAMRQTYLADRATKPTPVDKVKPAAAAKPASAPENAASRPVPQTAPDASDDQAALALGTTSDEMHPPLPPQDLIRALNFPESESDADGFAALRLALRDRNARHLVQASQDVLTLLSQDGIYMDDLRPEPVGADVLRRFADGERGAGVATLGTVHDRSSLALAAGRMREDTIFRDTVHHFLRRFDQMLATFAKGASDTELTDLAETRTARAFMLMGRVTGTFD